MSKHLLKVIMHKIKYYQTLLSLTVINTSYHNSECVGHVPLRVALPLPSGAGTPLVAVHW